MKNKVISYIEFYTYGTKKIINNISSKYNHLNKKYIIILIIGLMLFGSLTGFTDLVNGSNAPNVISNNLIHTLPKTSNSIIHKNSIFNTQIKEYYPLYINNTQSIATPSPYQQLINITTSSFSPYLHFNNTSANFEFLFGNGSVIHSWIESNISGIIEVWLKLPQINANSNIEINLAFGALTTNFLSNSGISGIGEAPQLSTTYAQFDNGPSVFPYYWNFAGTSLPSPWSNGGLNGFINNGIYLNDSSWGGILANSFNFSIYSFVIGMYLNVTGGGTMALGTYNGPSVAGGGNPYTLSTGRLRPAVAIGGTLNTVNFFTGWENISGDNFLENLQTGQIVNDTDREGLNQQLRLSSDSPNTQAYISSFAVRLLPPNDVMPTTSIGAIKINSNIINVGNNPNDIAISSNNIYVTNYGSGNVSVIGLSNNTNWKQITVGSFGCEPDAIALSTDNVYVASYVSGNVSISKIYNRDTMRIKISYISIKRR